MPPLSSRELIVLDMPSDSLANRSIASFWFLNVSKHCTQSANNGTSYYEQNSSLVTASSVPPLNPPTPACLSEGRRNNVLLGFFWGALLISLLSIMGLVILKHLRKARTIRETRQNWVTQQQEMAEPGLGTRGCIASPVVVVDGMVDDGVDGRGEEQQPRIRFTSWR